MNFWTFLHLNSELFAIVIVLGLCFGFGSCGDGKGCHVRLGCVSVEPLFDGGVK